MHITEVKSYIYAFNFLYVYVLVYMYVNGRNEWRG
jgi:hypothetical protein